jgi:hypothetical protein
MHAEKHAVTVTTDGSGDATEYSPNVTGRILGVFYAKTDFAENVDFTVTLEGTGEGLWTEEDVNASKKVYPRVDVQDLVGADRTYDDTHKIQDYVVAVNDRVKIVVANGGDTKTGTFTIVVG